MKKLTLLTFGILVSLAGTMYSMEQGDRGYQKKRKYEEQGQQYQNQQYIVPTLKTLALKKLEQLVEKDNSPQGKLELSLNRKIPLDIGLPSNIKLPYAYITYFQDEEDSSIGEIEHVFVDEPYRKKGLGRLLTNLACKELENMGCEEIALQVKSDNTGARDLYEKLGFVEDEEDNNKGDLLTYVKEISK